MRPATPRPNRPMMPGSGTGVGPPDDPPPDEVLDDVELLVEELVLDEVEL